MATQQDIKRRISSVNNTKKITKAMELVAGSRLRRAQARIEALRPYADRMQQLTVEVAAAAGDLSDQPLLARRDVKTVAVVALTGDRGLAGAFNANVVRRSLEIAREQRARGPRGGVAGGRPARRLDAAFPPPDADRRLRRHHRPARPTPTRRRSPSGWPTSTSRARSTRW